MPERSGFDVSIKVRRQAVQLSQSVLYHLLVERAVHETLDPAPKLLWQNHPLEQIGKGKQYGFLEHEVDVGRVGPRLH